MRNPAAGPRRRRHLRLVRADERAPVAGSAVDAANTGLRALEERFGRSTLYQLVPEDPDAVDAIVTSDPARLLARLTALTAERTACPHT